ALVFNQAAAGTFAGVISGTGSFTKLGAGNLTLSGANTYTGGITITAGTLTGNTTSLTGNIVDNAALVFNQAAAGTFAGVISGTGSFTKLGAGNLTLSGANTYGGLTTISGGTLTFAGSTAGLTGNMNNATAVVFNQAANSSFGGIISGLGTLTKSGAGNLTLSGANTYGGLTTISGGVLTFTGDTAGLTGNINNATAVVFNQAANSSFGGIISGAGTLTKSSTGTLILGGTNAYSGSTTINGGSISIATTDGIGNGSGTNTLTLNNGTLQTTASFTSARGITLNAGGGTFNVTPGATTTTLNGTIGGTGALTKTGAGTLILGGANTYTGGTTITGGTLTGNATSLTGNIIDNATLVLNQAAAGTFAGIISGTGTFIKLGAGNLTLSGANTYTGATTINGGALTLTGALNGPINVSTGSIFNVAGATLSAANPVTNNGTTNFTGAAVATNATITNNGGATVDISGISGSGISIGSLSGGGAVVLGIKTLTLGGLNLANTISGIVSGLGNLIKTGTNTLTLATAPTYQGTTTINGGTLARFLPTGTALTVNGGGTYNLDGANRTIGSLTGAGNVSLGAFILTTGGDHKSTLFSGVLSGAGGGLTKTGTGTFTLSGANTYTGPTTVNNGILQGTVPSASALTVTSPGVFNLTASQTIGSLSGNGNVTLGANTLTTGNNTNTTYSGILSDSGLGGGLTKAGAGTFTITTAPTYTGATLISGGTLAGSLPTNTALTVNGGATYNLNGANQTIGSLAGAGNVSLGASTLTTGGNNTNTTYSGVFSGAGGGLTKAGTGTFTITTLPTYTGNSTINAGTLAGILPTVTPLTINGGGTYNLNGANETIGSLQGAGFVQLGASTLTLGGNNNSTTYSGTFSGTGGVTKAGTGDFSFSGVGGNTGTTTVNGGSFTLTGSLSGPVAVNAGSVFNVAGSTLLASAPVTNNGTTNFTAAAAANNATITNNGGATVNISGISGASINIGSLSGAGNIILGAKNLTLGGLNTVLDTISGIISGVGGSLTKIGTGTVAISTVPTYTGPTTINDGILQGILPATTVLTVNSPGRYDLTANQTTAALIGSGDIHLNAFSLTTGGNNASTTYSGVMSGTGGLIKDGSGILTLLGANTFTGGITINGGDVQVGGGGIPDNETITLTPGSELTLLTNETIGALQGLGSVELGAFTLTTGGNNLSTNFGGVAFGTGGITKQGSGIFTLAGANTYTGRTTINSGTLTLTGSLSGPITVNAGSVFNVAGSTLVASNFITNNGTTNFTGAAAANNATITNNGGATVDISGVSGPSLSIGSLSGAGNIILGAKNLILGGLNISNTISGIISGVGGSLTKIGNGILTLTTTPTYTGATVVSGGTLAGFLPTSTILTVNGGATYNLNGANQTIGSLTGAGNVSLGAFTLTTGGNNASTTYSGIMSGVGGLTKTGAGTFTLSGANTYTGRTTIGSGTLTLIGSLSGPVTVNAGSVFNIAGSTLAASNPVTNNGAINFTGAAAANNAAISNNGGATVNISGISGPSLSVGSLSGAGNIILGAKNLILGGLNISNTISGIISGVGGSLTKIGNGILTLTTTPTYTGATVVNGGTLAGFLPTTTALTVNGGATYSLNGTNQTIGSLTGAGNVSLGAFTLTTGGNNTSTTYSGIMSGTGGLTKAGTGTFTLSGASTYTGPTMVNNGILQGTVSSASALTVLNPGHFNLTANQAIGSLAGNGGVTLNAFNLTTGANNTSTTYSGIMSGTGGLTKTGTGIFTLSGANTYTGPTTVNNGILQGTVSTSSALTVLNPGHFSLLANQTIGSLVGNGGVTLNAFTLTTGGNNTSTTYSGIMSGTGGLTKIGTGNFTLSGTNTYTGGTTITAGTLTGNTTSLTGNILDNAALVFNQTTAGTFAGNISGTGTLTKLGAGNLTLSGMNTYTGGTTITAGTLTGNTTSLRGNILDNASLIFNQTAAGTFAGNISGTGTLTKSGVGTLTLSGANTYAGPTTVNNGILQGVVPTATALTVTNPGVFNLNANRTIGSLTGNGSVTLNAFILTTGGNNASTTYSGVMSGTGGLTKTGTGNFTLSGANTYTGGTTITGGTLTGNTTSLTGNILDNAALVFNQTTAGTFAGNISGTGTLTKLGAGNLTLSGANTYTGGTTITAGILTGNTASLRGNILDNAALVFNQTTAGTFAGNISGIGTLTKSGAGTLTLSGANTYAGPTTVNNGILQGSVPTSTALTVTNPGVFNLNANRTIGSLTGNGGVTLNAFILTTGGNNTSTTYSGIMSDTGGLIKTGTGTFTLSGANTYTGPTTVNNGILQGTIPSTSALTITSPGVFNLNANRTIGSLAGNGRITLNAFNLTTGGNNTNTTYAGIMSGTGGLTKTGTGTFTLSGTNAYTGPTTVNNGSLQGAIPSASALTIANPGIFNLNADRTIGSLAGNGRVTLNTFHLTTGGNNASTTYAGIMSGTGGLIKTGTGTFTLSGANTYTGPTTVNNGILQGTIPTATVLTITSPGVFNLNANRTIGSLAGNGRMTLNAFSLTTGGNNTSTTYSGIMSGTGGLTKTGTGTFTLSGANTYTGTTTIAEGTLINNGTLASTVIVTPGTVYGGNGTSGSLINGGIVSPGNSIGTLFINGSYTQEAGRALNIEITPSGLTDLLQVKGTATLDGILNVLPLGSVSSFVHRTYIFLTAGNGVIGHFASVPPITSLSFTLNYLPNAVELIVKGASFSSLVSSGNAGIIAQYIDEIVAKGKVTPDLKTVLNALSDAAAEGTTALTAALNQISPDPYRELVFLAFDKTNLLRQSVSSQQQRLINNHYLKSLTMDEIVSEKLDSFQNYLHNRNLRGGFQPMNYNAIASKQAKNAKDKFGAPSFNKSSLQLQKAIQIGKSNVWIEPYGQAGRKKNSSSLAGTTSNIFGVTVGGDTLVAPNTYVGIFSSIIKTHFDWTQHRGNGNIKSYFGGIYALWLSKTGFYLDGQIALGGGRYKARRNIKFQNINRTASSTHNGLSFATDLEAGYLWTVGKTLIQPFFNFAYVGLHETAFSEKGANSLNAKIASNTSQFARTELGPIVSYFFTCDETIIYPSVKLSWVQKRPLGNIGKREKFNLNGQSFGTTVYGDNRVRNLLSSGLSLTTQFKNGIYISGDINAEAGSGEKLGQIMLNLGYNF
ncbi:MAG: autotransporter-associated beta strand repeat-containing protein, partial [Alphaproteobacteria bacterium]|nr:autotransporter-associated beta strand repeat-containing protein [Alphaproteobacteria bacterium]